VDEDYRLKVVLWGMAIAGFAMLAIAWSLDDADAHDAPTGWSYGLDCCSNRDCGEVPAEWIIESPDGVRIVPTGELIPYDDKRIKDSPDGRTHWCRPPGIPDPRTICVYVPSKGV